MAFTKDQLAALLKDAADPNKAPLALQQLSESVGGLIDEHATATATIAERDRTIGQLRDTNMALFLKTTGEPPATETPKEKTDDEIFDDLFTKQVLGKE